MKKVLVTGGCGFIGSHTIVDLLDHGFSVVSADNLSNSDGSAMEGIRKITGKEIVNYNLDLCDSRATRQLFEDHPDFCGIVHFAALKLVGESVEQPVRYYRNNLNSLLNILDGMETFGIAHLIFSSSCSVYGNSKELPVTEETPLQEAESPYARTKQMGEEIIRDFTRVHPAHNGILLRYFNPAGAHESILIGEAPSNPASNLVPVITETAIGKRAGMVVFGNDYPTRDGSCVRDFIHVMDLANAHTRALQYLLDNRQERNCETFNLGTGRGVTVLEAIQAFETVTGQKLKYRIGPRRPGDVVEVYANKDRSEKRLGWHPTRTIEEIMHTAWEWEKRR